MPRRILITGGSGFVGQWLARELLHRGDTVIATTFAGAPAASTLTDAERGTVSWLELDVTDGTAVRAAVTDVKPDWIAHLAGVAFPPEANAAPERAFAVNAGGALNVLSAAAVAAPAARVLIVGTADQYGAHPAARQPLEESASQEPRSFYGASKAAQEILALRAWRATGQPVICTRSFNHSGAGHGDAYLLPSLVKRALALPDRGGQLLLGNLEPVRDYLHVRDVVEAYIALLETGVPGEVYNVSSGVGTSVRQLADRVLARVRRVADLGTDPALVRKSDTPVLVGSNARLRAATGWTPRRGIDDIIDDLIHATAR